MLCPHCRHPNPASARYCMHCGELLPEAPPEAPGKRPAWSRWWIPLLASLLVSIILTKVFHLPVLILAGVLPLFWLGRSRED